LYLTAGSDSSPQPGYDDGSDHPRLAATPVPGELAARASLSDNILTFHRFDSSQHEAYNSIIGPTSPGEDALETCPFPPNLCGYELYELGTTMLWVPASHMYVAVYSAYDTGGPTQTSVGLWYKTSSDEGQTWSAGTQLAGPSVDASYLVMEETLAYDRKTGDTVLAYYEVPQQGSYIAKLQLQVLHPGATAWTAPQTIRTVNWYWDNRGSHTIFGDYFGLQAHDGVAHIAEQYYDAANKISNIEYFALRYPR
jgi:hypothetical protein